MHRSALRFLLPLLAALTGCAGAPGWGDDGASADSVQIAWITQTCDLPYEDAQPGDMTVYLTDEGVNAPIPRATTLEPTAVARVDLALDGTPHRTSGAMRFCGMASVIEWRVARRAPLTVEVSRTFEGTRTSPCNVEPMPAESCAMTRRIVYPERLVVDVRE
jgi:hypothetical protein